MVKNSIKLGIAALAVVAIALGIGIGVGQKNSQKASSSSNLSDVSNVYAAYDLDCVDTRRELVVPGTEEYHGLPTNRRMLFRKVVKTSNRQTRKLGTESIPDFDDEGFIRPEEIEVEGSGDGSSSGSSSGSGKSGKSGGSGSAAGKSGKSDGSGSSSSKGSKVSTLLFAYYTCNDNGKLQLFRYDDTCVHTSFILTNAHQSLPILLYDIISEPELF